MKVYKDFLNGDELFSDAFPIKVVNDFVWEVEGCFIRVKNGVDGSLIGANPSAEGGEDDCVQDDVRTVINVVESHQLESTSFETAKDYQLYLKDYLKRVICRIEERCPEKKEQFQKAVTEYFKKKVIGDFKNIDFYRSTNSYLPDQYIIPCNFREDGTTPYFVFIADGLDEEKC
nr:gag pol polyprotein [Hymenolepis microstoma]